MDSTVTSTNITPTDSVDDTHTHDVDGDHSLVTNIVAAITLSIIIIVSLCANALATSTIVRVRALRANAHNHLILNLNIVSLCITLFSMPLTLLSIFDEGELLAHSPGLCAFNGFSSIAFPIASSMTVLWIAVDRYLTVVWSKKFPPSTYRTLAMIISTWTLSFIIAILPVFKVLSEYYYMHDTHHCSPVWDMCEFYFVVFFAIYGLSIPVMLISYMFVVVHLCKKERKMQSHHSQSFRSRSHISRSERSIKRSKKHNRRGRSINDRGASPEPEPGSASKEERGQHDSGYTTPPKGSQSVAYEYPSDQQTSGHDTLSDLTPNDITDWRQKNPNTNNSANTDNDDNETLSAVCRSRKQSVAEIVNAIEKAKLRHDPRCDSLPRLRVKKINVSSELRKSASLGDIVDMIDSTFSNDVCVVSSDNNISPSKLPHDKCDSQYLNESVPEESCCSADSDNPQDPIWFTSRSDTADRYPPASDTLVDEEVAEESAEDIHGRTTNDKPRNECLEEAPSSGTITESLHHLVPEIIVEDLTRDCAVQGDEDNDVISDSDFCIKSESGKVDSSQAPAAFIVTQHLMLSKEPALPVEDEHDVDVLSPSRDHIETGTRSLPMRVVAPKKNRDFKSLGRNGSLMRGENRSHRQERRGSDGSVSSGRLLDEFGSRLRRGNSRRPSMRVQLTADKQVALMGGLLVLTAVVCWTPYFVIHSCFFPMDIAPHWTSILTMWLGYANAMLNPLIYSFTNRRIRAMVGAFCGKRCDRIKSALFCRNQT